MKIKLFAAVFVLAVVGQAYAQGIPFGKNIVHWDGKEVPHFYSSEHFDVYHNLDVNDERQREHLRKVVGDLENAYAWMSGKDGLDHFVEKKINAIVYNTHAEFEGNYIIAYPSLPEGIGAFVDRERNRLVTKNDFMPQLGRAVNVHELVHVFQNDIGRRNFISRLVGADGGLPNGFYEGGAEYIAGLYDPHTRDDIRRRHVRVAAADPHFVPTWEQLKADAVNGYTMWAMLFEFLDKEYGPGTGIKFHKDGLRNRRLGQLLYHASKGALGNPDVNPEKFNRLYRNWWTSLFRPENDKRPTPFENTPNYTIRSVTPYGHPYPLFSPTVCKEGKEIYAFTQQASGIALVKFPVLPENEYVPELYTNQSSAKKETEEAEKRIIDPRKLVVNLTPQLPPEPWETIVAQGLGTWPFNGRDADCSPATGELAFFAVKDGEHQLALIDPSKPGKVNRILKLGVDQAFSPSFSPDGKKVYFSAARNVTRDIYAVDLETGEVTNLTNDERFDTAPAASPYGQRIVYVGQDGDFQHLFLLDLATGQKEQITFGRHNDSSPAWASDSSTVVYSSDISGRIWNLYTMEIGATPDPGMRTSSQWTDFYGGVETPVFIPGSKDKVYLVVFHGEDQFQSQIYPNFELFEASLKEPLASYQQMKTNESNVFWFNPTRDLFKFELDTNQMTNPQTPKNKWRMDGSTAYLGASTYWGVFGSTWMQWSNLLNNKTHAFQYASFGSFRLMNYSYINREGRWTKVLGAYEQKYPMYYQFYDIAERAPRQPLLQFTWSQEVGAVGAMSYPLNKWNRVELFSKIRRRSYDFGGLTPELIREFPDFFSPADVALFNNLYEANGANASFGAAYVRDTVIYSNTAWGPWHGNAFKVQVEAAPPLGNLFESFVSANAQARIYRRLSAGTLLAGRVEAMTTTRANGDLLLLCGPERLRGCDYGSIAGNQVAYGSVELRFPLIDAVVAPGRFNIGAARGFLFADVGLAKFSNSDYPLRKAMAYGAGIQYMLPIIGMPMNTVWTRENDKWVPSFYITWAW